MIRTSDHHTYNTDTSSVIATNKSEFGRKGEIDYKDITLYRTKRGRLFILDANACKATKKYVYYGNNKIWPVEAFWNNTPDDMDLGVYEWWVAEVPREYYYNGVRFTSYDYYDFLIENQKGESK